MTFDKWDITIEVHPAGAPGGAQLTLNNVPRGTVLGLAGEGVDGKLTVGLRAAVIALTELCEEDSDAESAAAT